MLDEQFWKVDPEEQKAIDKEQLDVMLQFSILEHLLKKELLTEEEFLNCTKRLMADCKYPVMPFILEGMLNDRKRKKLPSGDGEYL